MFAFAGCSEKSSTESATSPDSNEQQLTAVDGDAFDIDQYRGEGQVVEGTLEGNFMLNQSGEEFGVTDKSRDPMRIRLRSFPLALSGKTDDIVQQLLENEGNRVRLVGAIAKLKVEGRGRQSGQGGYYGPIPAHILYYMIVSSCEPIDSVPGEGSIRNQ